MFKTAHKHGATLMSPASAASLSLSTMLILSGCGGGGSGDGVQNDPPAGTFSARVAPVAPPPFICGVAGSETNRAMGELNYFWQSNVVACGCELDALGAGCYRNAMVLSAGYGYIFYDRQLLASMDNSTGSSLPADMVLAHEFGHNIQMALNLPASGSKGRELQADCLAGFFVGYKVRQGTASQNDVISTFNQACSLGDPMLSPWWVPGAHGVCPERVSALQRGINGYLNGLLPGQACPSI